MLMSQQLRCPPQHCPAAVCWQCRWKGRGLFNPPSYSWGQILVVGYMYSISIGEASKVIIMLISFRGVYTAKNTLFVTKWRELSYYLHLCKVPASLRDEIGACSANCSYITIHNIYQRYHSGYKRHWKTLFIGLCFRVWGFFLCFGDTDFYPWSRFPMPATRKQNVLRRLSALLSSLGSMINCNFF